MFLENSRRSPKHPKVGWSLVRDSEAEPFVETSGRVDLENLQPDGIATGTSFGLEIADDGCSEAMILKIRSDHNVEEPDFLRPMAGGEVADIAACH